MAEVLGAKLDNESKNRMLRNYKGKISFSCVG
jgi:hypothetical protein